MPDSATTSASPATNAAVSLLRYRTATPASRVRVLLPQHLITFLLEGEKTIRFAGAQVTVHPHQCALLAAGNCLMSEKAAARTGDYHSLMLLFDNQVLADFFSRHAAWLDQPLEPIASQPFLLVEQDEFLRHFVGSLDCLLTPGQPTLPPELPRVKLEELLLYLALRQPEQLRQFRSLSREDSAERLVRQAVTAHLDTAISVEELAFLCHMSLSTFKRRFAHLYGTSPSRWLLARRMEKAARLLRQAGCQVHELSEALGYENPSGFIQSFKQVYGVTPKQYQLSALFSA